MTRSLFAVLHLIALGIGLGAVWARARHLQALARGGPIRPVFNADTWWMVALTLWLVTGLVRLLAGLEKPAAYYIHNPLFWSKMGAAALLYTLELWPMAALIQWGIWARKGRGFGIGAAPRLAAISYAQAALIPLLVILAVAMARGYGVPAA